MWHMADGSVCPHIPAACPVQSQFIPTAKTMYEKEHQPTDCRPKLVRRACIVVRCYRSGRQVQSPPKWLPTAVFLALCSRHGFPTTLETSMWLRLALYAVNLLSSVLPRQAGPGEVSLQTACLRRRRRANTMNSNHLMDVFTPVNSPEHLHQRSTDSHGSHGDHVYKAHRRCCDSPPARR